MAQTCRRSPQIRWGRCPGTVTPVWPLHRNGQGMHPGEWWLWRARRRRSRSVWCPDGRKQHNVTKKVKRNFASEKKPFKTRPETGFITMRSVCFMSHRGLLERLPRSLVVRRDLWPWMFSTDTHSVADISKTELCKRHTTVISAYDNLIYVVTVSELFFLGGFYFI